MEQFPGKDWITCNFCCIRASATTSKFFLTSCAHIYCKNCTETEKVQGSLSKSSKFTCRHCNKVTNLIEISNNMPESVKIFFRKPEDLWAEENAEIGKIIRFQNSHFIHLLKHHAKLRSDNEKFKAYCIDISKKKKQLERKLLLLHERLGITDSFSEYSRKVNCGTSNASTLNTKVSDGTTAEGGPKVGNTTFDLNRSLLASFPNFSALETDMSFDSTANISGMLNACKNLLN